MGSRSSHSADRNADEQLIISDKLVGGITHWAVLMMGRMGLRLRQMRVSRELLRGAAPGCGC